MFLTRSQNPSLEVMILAVRRESDRVRRLLSNFPKLGQEEVCFRLFFAISAPSIRFWYKVRSDCVNGFQGLECAFGHEPACLTQ